MSEIRRYSSLSSKEFDAAAFLRRRLPNALSYDRIAGYFSSSLLPLIQEQLDSVQQKTRLVCNSHVTGSEIVTAKLARASAWDEWLRFVDGGIGDGDRRALASLYNLITHGKLEIRIIPDTVHGLLHGKAGLITMADGSTSCFVGSANETLNAWSSNYEIIWEDPSDTAATWFKTEFQRFWNNPAAIPLPEAILADIARQSTQKIINTTQEWIDLGANPAAVVNGMPISREEGLWNHQKFFADLVFRKHQTRAGARFVLADTVGLGKTAELGTAAQLIALVGERPILVIAPRTLLEQWQDELWSRLGMPSAYFDGFKWVDETDKEYATDLPITRCPRRVGIVSQGLFTSRSPKATALLGIDYDCVIVDEAHRARRDHGEHGGLSDSSVMTNLLAAINKLSLKTHSMLLSTATPVQVNPLEAFDLLEALSKENDSILGSSRSKWRTDAVRGLKIVTGEDVIETENRNEFWMWLRDPLPDSDEGTAYGALRSSLHMADEDYVSTLVHSALSRIPASRVAYLASPATLRDMNPYVHHIVRRTREQLENTINPETNEPYLEKIAVRLFGESANEAIDMSSYLKEAYAVAGEFAHLLDKRKAAGGFRKTILLRRLGSTIAAGTLTAKAMASAGNITAPVASEEEEDAASGALTSEEKKCLERFVSLLKGQQDRDPKYESIVDYLQNKGWASRGCVVFSQYYDSIQWLGERLLKDLPQYSIGVYAGGGKQSSISENGVLVPVDREDVREAVAAGKIQVLLGTDAASEGLNLQRLSSLINLDLPWNPTRLEQRKGRIQRPGQRYDEVFIYNMRYRDSVEDRVHQLLSGRLQDIYSIFGQIPDILEDVWIAMALEGRVAAEQVLSDEEPKKNPFEARYVKTFGAVSWDRCGDLLKSDERIRVLREEWNTAAHESP